MKKMLVAGCGLVFAAGVVFMTARASVGEQPGTVKPAAIEASAANPAKAEPAEASPATVEPAAAPKPVISAHRSAAHRQAGKQDGAISSVPIVVFTPRYGSSPRIIHVTRPGARAEMGASGSAETTVTIDDVGNDVVPRKSASDAAK
jgi:hypothetical protein